MTRQRITTLFGVLGIAVLLGTSGTGQSQVPDPPLHDEGIEVQARGPIHEAFAEPVGGQPGPGAMVPKQPPAPLEELAPEQRPEGENVQFIPGYWAWDEDRNDFLWVSGFWRVPPPNRQWVPGHWMQAAGGWQWSHGHWALPQAQEIQFLPPPPAAIDDAPAIPQPGPDHVFVHGCHVWHTNRYLWRPGFWQPYRPGYIWVPAHYIWAPAGHIFVDGYWDLDLARRGILFAPVYVPPHVWGRPRWAFQPRFTVQLDFLWGSLWVRPAHRHYYFGDYYEPLYQRRGFTPWVDYRWGRHGYDPLYSYYRHQHARDPRWDRDLRDLYAGRSNGTVTRPPRTLVQQTTLIQNITNNKIQVNNVRNVTALSPLAQAAVPSGVRLQPLTQERRREEQAFSQQLRDVGRQRQQQETKILSTAGSAKTIDTPRTVRLDLPRPRVRAQDDPTPGKPQPPVKPPITTVQPPPGKPQPPKVDPVKPGTPPKTETPKPVTPPKVDSPKPVKPPKGEAPKPVTPPKGEAPKPVTPPKADAPKPVTPPKGEAPKPVPPPKTETPKPTPPPKVDAPKPTPPPKVDAPKPVPPPKVDAPRPAQPPKPDVKPTPPPKADAPKPVPPPVKPPTEVRPQPTPQPVKPPPPTPPKVDPKPPRNEPPRTEVRPATPPPPRNEPPRPVAPPRTEVRPATPPPPPPRTEVRPTPPPTPPPPRTEVRPPPPPSRPEVRPTAPPPAPPPPPPRTEVRPTSPPPAPPPPPRAETRPTPPPSRSDVRPSPPPPSRTESRPPPSRGSSRSEEKDKKKP